MESRQGKQRAKVLLCAAGVLLASALLAAANLGSRNSLAVRAARTLDELPGDTVDQVIVLDGGSGVLQLVSAVTGILVVVATAVYVWLTYRLTSQTQIAVDHANMANELARAALDRQTRTSAAAVFAQLRRNWHELDRTLLEYAKTFHDLQDEPVGSFILANGLPNPDPRLYIGFMFFGVIEEMIILQEELELASVGYVSSFAVTVRGIMAMPIVREIWAAIRDQYSQGVRRYIEDAMRAAG